MSSQGPASSTDKTNFGYPGGSSAMGTLKPRDYTYGAESIRDASDYTQFIRQSKVYNSYVGPTAPLNNRPEIYGCWFRLQYLLGRHKQGVCLGYSGLCPDSTAADLTGEIGQS